MGEKVAATAQRGDELEDLHHDIDGAVQQGEKLRGLKNTIEEAARRVKELAEIATRAGTGGATAGGGAAAGQSGSSTAAPAPTPATSGWNAITRLFKNKSGPFEQKPEEPKQPQQPPPQLQTGLSAASAGDGDAAIINTVKTETTEINMKLDALRVNLEEWMQGVGFRIRRALIHGRGDTLWCLTYSIVGGLLMLHYTCAHSLIMRKEGCNLQCL